MYPKPLSEKTLSGMYKKEEIDDEKRDFLLDFFSAAANLYGQIELNDLWNVYKELSEKTEVPAILKKQLTAFAEITRRKGDIPYYVFEVDEVFSAERRRDSIKFIVSKELAFPYVRSWSDSIYYLRRNQGTDSFWIPENFTDYKDIPRSREEKALEDYLGELVITKVQPDMHIDERGESDILGAKLSAMYFINKEEQKRFNTAQNRNSEREWNELNRIIWRAEPDKVTYHCHMDMLRFGAPVKTELDYITTECNEIGAPLTGGQRLQIRDLLAAMEDSLHIWVDRGWTTHDLIRGIFGETAPEITWQPDGSRVVQLGSALSDTDLRNTAVRRLRRHGLGSV